MKTKILLLLLFISFFDCQNTTIDQREDWIQQIDKEILKFEKTKEVFKEQTFVRAHETFTQAILKSKESSIVKYQTKGEADMDETFPMSIEIYLKKGKVIFSKWSGLFPYLYKGQKPKNAFCCYVFVDYKYFKSPTEAIKFIKKIDLNSAKDYNIMRSQLSDLPFEEEVLNNAQMDYERLMENVDDISKKLQL